MAKKKYYAVKCGTKPGIYETWAECEAQTKGFSGALFKSFGSLSEAEEYMNGEDGSGTRNSASGHDFSAQELNRQVEEELQNLGATEVIAFVDGSYSHADKMSGFGAIIIDARGVQTSLSKSFTKQQHPDFLELRNVAAELEGVKAAVTWAIANEKTRIKIYYDYAGIENWADGSWKANKDITKQYVAFIREKKAFITVDFCKVPAHSGIEYNEKVDQLAKNSLWEEGV
jgi:ribonuclease HI